MAIMIALAGGALLIWILLGALALCFGCDHRFLNRHGDVVAWIALPASLLLAALGWPLCLLGAARLRMP